MDRGIRVFDGDWRTAITEAIRRRHEHQGDDAVVTFISPTTEQENLNDDTEG